MRLVSVGGKNPVLLIKIEKCHKKVLKDIASLIVDNEEFGSVKFVVFMEEKADLSALNDVVWRAANNIDPARDCFFVEKEGEKVPVLFMDATRKTLEHDGFERPWPNIVTMDKATIRTVDYKWEKYGIGKFIESPSLKYIEQLYPGGAVAE